MIPGRGLFSLLLAGLMSGCSSSVGEAPQTAQDEQRQVMADAGRTAVVGQAPAGAFVRLEPVLAQDFPPPAGEAFIDQSGQMFEPGAVAVRRGSPSNFAAAKTSSITSASCDLRTGRLIFNVATPPWGAYTHTFDEAGTYDVTCDIHAAMRATILVAATPYVTIADENGRFRFRRRRAGLLHADWIFRRA